MRRSPPPRRSGSAPCGRPGCRPSGRSGWVDELLDPKRFELLIQYSRAANFASTRYEDAVVRAPSERWRSAEDLGDPIAAGAGARGAGLGAVVA